MDFSRVEADAPMLALAARVAQFVDRHVTPDVHQLERDTGSEFNRHVHLAMGAEGWIVPTRPIAQGGADIDRAQARLVELMLEDAGVPAMSLNTTRHLLPVIEKFGDPALVADLVPRIMSGHAVLSMGLTEADGGSDVAAARTKAVRDGDDWLITGYKPFVTGAHHADYCFLVTRSDPAARKHRGISIFLVPMTLDGIEVQPVKWLSGERANGVFFNETRVPDHFRLGEPGQGWGVLNYVLDIEHGLGKPKDGLEDSSFGDVYMRRIERMVRIAVDHLRGAVDLCGRPMLENDAVRATLGEIHIDMETTRALPGSLGRAYGNDASIRIASHVVDLLGLESLVDDGHSGSVDHGVAAFAYAWAQGQAIGGGTVEIVRSIIAQQDLGLPRPYFPPQDDGGSA